MNKRRIAVAFAVVVAVGAGGFWWFWSAEPPEPVYRGKTLSAWLDDRRSTAQGPGGLTDEAVAAVRAMGPEAIPTLLTWLGRSDPKISRNAKVLLEFQLKLPVRVPTNQDKRMRAMLGFRALGVIARPVFPSLVALALHSHDEWQRGDAINALTESDADAMKQLAEGLKSPDAEVGLRAIFSLTCLRIAPDEVCLPALEEALKDPDPRVVAKATSGIALFNQNLKRFAGWLKHRDPAKRIFGARMVGDYRSRARPFLPELEAAALDDDPEVRAAVAQAISKVRGTNPLSAD